VIQYPVANGGCIASIADSRHQSMNGSLKNDDTVGCNSNFEC